MITARGTDLMLTYEVAANGTFGATRDCIARPDAVLVGVHLGRHPRGDRGLSRREGRRAAAASSYAIVDGSLVPRTASVGNGRSEICWAVIRPTTALPMSSDPARDGQSVRSVCR